MDPTSTSSLNDKMDEIDTSSSSQQINTNNSVTTSNNLSQMKSFYPILPSAFHEHQKLFLKLKNKFEVLPKINEMNSSIPSQLSPLHKKCFDTTPLVLEADVSETSHDTTEHQFQILLYRDRHIVVYDRMNNEINAKLLSTEEHKTLTSRVLGRCPTCGRTLDPSSFPYEDRTYFSSLWRFVGVESNYWRSDEIEETDDVQSVDVEEMDTAEMTPFCRGGWSDTVGGGNEVGGTSDFYSNQKNVKKKKKGLVDRRCDESNSSYEEDEEYDKDRDIVLKNTNEIVEFSEKNEKTLNYMMESISTSPSKYVVFEPPSRRRRPSVYEAIPLPKNISRDFLNTGYYERLFVELRKLGFGSNGQVFLCTHILDNVNIGTFAVKKMPVGDDKAWFRKMIREVKIRENLRHNNIVEYKHSWLEMHRSNEFCPWVPWLFVLMEYCNGDTLENFIWNGSSSSMDSISYLSDCEIWKLLLDILAGLRYLHHCGILHRDLKTSNILMNYTLDKRDNIQSVNALLTDFGTSEMMNEKTAKSNRGGFTGTIEYTAPELLEVDDDGNLRDDYDEKSDMWSLGIMLHAMCYGQLPYVNSDPKVCRVEILKHKRLTLPDTPKRSASLKQLILALTSRDPSRRPSTDEILNSASIYELSWNSKYLSRASRLLSERVNLRQI